MDSSVQALMEGCFTNARFRCVQSFTFKCRQCSDIADYFAEIGPEFRFPVWESYLRDQTRGGAAGRRCEQAMMDFCRAVKDAELFLKDHCCTSASKNNWPLCAQGLTKLDTREAYDVHLQNLIWSKTSLEVAMLTTSGGARGVMISSDDVQRLVADRRRVLCRYASSYKERQILLDRLDFNESIEGLISANNSGEDHKYLAFLLRKSQALQELRGGQRDKGLTYPFQISDSELNSGNEEELGRGGFAERVYSTLWLGQIRVAVKVIRLADSDSDNEAEESEETGSGDKIFMAEVSLLGRLQSPYIVQLIGWAIDKNKRQGKLVTQLVATDLFKVLHATENRSGLPLHAAVDLMLQISKAMEYLHGQNVIHRDIKPSNILLEPSSVSGFWRVQLCDFGIAKMKERGAVSARFSTFEMGTGWYRSPEVLSEQVKYSNKVDVYSFAITCSEILGGNSATLSLRRAGGRTLLNRIQSNQRPSLPADCPAHLSDLIRKCWNTEPEKRLPFCHITNTLSYIKFVLMRGSGSGFLTPFDEYELTACMSGIAQTEAVRAEAAMWDLVPRYSTNEIGENNQRPEATRIRMCLQSGEFLRSTESLTFGQFQLTMQEDGNLVLFDCANIKVLWASGHTATTSFSGLPFVCFLTPTGNLVVHSRRQEVWSSGSNNSRASYKLELDGDGRAIIKGPNGGTIWATERKVMNIGDVLLVHHSLTNNGYSFCMESDGNLVLYNEYRRRLWTSNTNNTANTNRCKCTLQEDGLLVVRNPDRVVWSSAETGEIASYKVELQRDGNVAIVHPTGHCIWETCTSSNIDIDNINY